jgi:3-methyladenine DNA glycosylase AlkD
MEYQEIIELLRSKANPANVVGMARFGINSENTLGISMVEIRAIAKTLKRNHSVALKLWESGLHEARILAGLCADPKLLDPETMDAWTEDFDSWDVCDQVCMNLYDKTPCAYSKIYEWAGDEREFVRRAAFALLAALAVHDKKRGDDVFEEYYPLIIEHSVDSRNFVKKAVNWALRQIGKRSMTLLASATETAEKILKLDSTTARWIATDALREFKKPEIIKRVERKANQ